MANERGGMDGTSIDWSFATSQAYLPPRSPMFSGGGSNIPENNSSFFSNWPKLPHPGGNRRHQRTQSSTSFLPQTPAWVDDLLNDTLDVPPVKNLHRRSSSDSIAFLEAPLQHVRIHDIAEEEELDSGGMVPRLSRGFRDFDKLDEERLMPKVAGSGSFQKHHAALSNVSLHSSPSERRVPLETSSTPSDHDSANASSLDDKRARGVGQSKNDTEVQSTLKAEHTTLSAGKGETLPATDMSLDPKRAKRILANRQSAQRSRVRKLQYISELERTVNVLQEEVSTLSPQVTYLDRHRIILNVDNSAMKQRIAALAQEKLFKDAHNEALKNEVHRLRQLYQQQQQKHAHQNLSRQISHPLSPQLELKEPDLGCVEDVFKETEADLLKGHAAPPRSPLMKPIGPSSCSTGEKGKGGGHSQIMPGIAQLHSVQNL